MIIHKYRNFLLLLILLTGFLLRLSSASSVPINEDEWHDFRSASMISFNVHHRYLPVTDSLIDGSSMGFRYLIKTGWMLFGNTILGARIPFVIAGTLTILLLYHLVKNRIDTQTALLSAVLLAISQFAIGTSRFADICAIIPLIVTGSLFLFSNAIKENRAVFFFANGLIIGIGLWFKETLIVLIPIYILFLFLSPEYRHQLKNKYLWISFLMAGAIVTPLLAQTLKPGSSRIEYVSGAVNLQPSLGPLSLYLGELILYILKPFPALFERLAITFNSESLPVNSFLGILILTAVFKYRKDQNPFIHLLIIHFLFVFISFSFFRKGAPEWGIWSFESFYFSTITFIPGIILASVLIKHLLSASRPHTTLWVSAFFIFMFVRAIDVATFPVSFFYPAKNFCLRQLSDYKGGCFRDNPQIPDETKIDILTRICDLKNVEYATKKNATLKVAKLLFKKGNIEKSKEYIYRLLSLNPTDQDALDFLDVMPDKQETIAGVKTNAVEWVGAWPRGPVNAISMKNNILYAAAGGEIEMWDVNNAQNPEKIGSLITQGIVMELLIKGNFLYVSLGNDGVSIFNVSNPTNPKKITRLASNQWATAVYLHKDYLYQCDAYGGLSIYNISDINNPTQIVQLPFDYAVNDIIISPPYAYVATNQGLKTYQITHLKNTIKFTEVASHHLGTIKDILIYHGHLYLAAHNKGLFIFDMENPAHPKQVRHMQNITGETDHLLIHEDHLFLAADEGGVFIFDITEAQNPLQIHTIKLGATENLFIKENKLYVASDESGVYIVDISDIINPRILSHFSGGGEVTDIMLQYPDLYVAASSNGLYILDVENPQDIKEKSRTDVNGSLYGITPVNDQEATLHIELATSNIVDISDMTRPRPMTLFDIGNVDDMIFTNPSYTYAICDYLNFYVLDLSVPLKPKQISSIEVPEGVRLFIEQNTAYVLTKQNQLIEVDVSQPYSPQISHEFDLPESRSLVLKNGWVYLSDTNKNLKIYDLNQNLLEQAHQINFPVEKIFADKNLIFLISPDNIINIFDISAPATPELLTQYPFGQKVSQLCFIKNHTFILSDKGFSIFRISDKGEMLPVSDWAQKDIKSLAVSNTHALLINENGTIDILDISNLQQINKAGQINTETSIKEIFINNHYAYVIPHSYFTAKINIDGIHSNPEIKLMPVNRTVTPLIERRNPKCRFRDKIYFGKGQNLYEASVDEGENITENAQLLYTLPDEIRQIYVQEKESGLYFYIANEDAGVQVLRKPL